eukprot:11017041-Heterocapsa_arctica.AAC.1
MVSRGEEWSWITLLVRTRGTSARQSRCCACRGCSICVFATACAKWVSDVCGPVPDGDKGREDVRGTCLS